MLTHQQIVAEPLVATARSAGFRFHGEHESFAENVFAKPFMLLEDLATGISQYTEVDSVS